MRTDVKLGLVGSLAVVVMAGWYFADEDVAFPDIPLNDFNPRTNRALPTLTGRSEQKQNESALAPPQRDHHQPSPPPPSNLPPSAGQADADPRRANDDADSLSDLFALQPVDDEATKNEAFFDWDATSEPPHTEEFSQPPATAEDHNDSNVTSATKFDKSSKSTETHTVRAGDTFAALARIYYGDVRHARRLREANPHVIDSTAMALGVVLNIPDFDDLDDAATQMDIEKPTPVAIGPRTCKVREGDSLYGIAREHLASGARWKEIYQLNKAMIGDDPSRLKVGQVLTLPGD